MAKRSALPGFIAAFDFGAQPGPRVSPKPVSTCSRQANEFARSFYRQTSEEMQLYEFSSRSIFNRQSAESLVQRYQIGGFRIEADAGIQINALSVPAVLRALLASSIFHK